MIEMTATTGPHEEETDWKPVNVPPPEEERMNRALTAPLKRLMLSKEKPPGVLI
jgi:hypothetical protein